MSNGCDKPCNNNNDSSKHYEPFMPPNCAIFIIPQCTYTGMNQQVQTLIII